jgi:lipid A ethanolaminephosphotransferase
MQHLPKYTKSMFEGQGVRPGRNPTRLLILVSLWIATVGNAALWLELYRLGHLKTATGWWMVVCLVILIAATLVAVTVLLAWCRSIKPLIIGLLLVTSLGVHVLLSDRSATQGAVMASIFRMDLHSLLNWRFFITVLIIAIPPWLWLRSQQVQHWGWRKQLLRNLLVLLAACGVIAVALTASPEGLTSLSSQYAHMRGLINPLNVFDALDAISKIIKP